MSEYWKIPRERRSKEPSRNEKLAHYPRLSDDA
jgi:hypothetical protein